MKSIKFNKINNFIIFGGGKLIADICSILKLQKKKIFVFTSKPQSKEIISENLTLRKYLIKNKIEYRILNNLDILHKYNFINKHSLGISNSCRWIFKKKDIKLFNNRLINIHYSNLPFFRGAGGLSWNILTNNFNSGTTIHLINEKIDAGKYLFKKSFKFPHRIRTSLKDMQEFSIIYQKKVIRNFMKDLLNEKNFKLKDISNKNSFYWPKLDTRKNGWINWNWESKEIVDFINSFSEPYEGASTMLNNKIIRLKSAKKANSKIKFHPYQNGLIYKKIKNSIFVVSKNGGIIIDVSHLKNTKNFLGKRLFTPNQKLQNALQGE